MATTVIRTEGQFELRSVSSIILGEPVTGFVAWDTVAGESIGMGVVPTLAEAESLMEMGHASARLDALRLARRLRRH